MNRRGLIFGSTAALAFGEANAAPPRYVYDPKTAGDSYVVRTGLVAFQLKLAGIGSMSQAAATGVVAPALAAGLNLNQLSIRESNTIWGQFFRGAQIMLGHVDSDTPIVGYYNPILDYWWITLWSAQGTVRQITAAKLLPGGGVTTSRTHEVDSKPTWMRRLGLRTIIEELRISAVDPGLQFKRTFPMDNAGPPKAFDRLISGSAEQELFVRRGLSAASTISAFTADTKALAAYVDVMGALDRARPVPPPSLASTAVQGFAATSSTPLASRAGMRPLAAFMPGDNWYVISAGPGSGRLLLLSAMSKQTHSLAQLAFIDTQGGA